MDEFQVKMDSQNENNDSVNSTCIQLKRLIWAFIILIPCVTLSGISLLVTDYRRPRGNYPQDFFHSNFPFVPCLLSLNVIMFVAAFIELFVILFDNRRLIIIKRVAILFSILFMLRNLSMIVTSLPDPSPLCRRVSTEQLNINPRSIFDALTGITCGDMIFSGHTITLLMPPMLHMHYFGGIMSIFFWINAFVGTIFILLSRLHYSIDIFIAYLVVPFVFWIYHLVAEHEFLFQDIPSLFFWYFRNMEWNGVLDKKERHHVHEY